MQTRLLSTPVPDFSLCGRWDHVWRVDGCEHIFVPSLDWTEDCHSFLHVPFACTPIRSTHHSLAISTPADRLHWLRMPRPSHDNFASVDVPQPHYTIFTFCSPLSSHLEIMLLSTLCYSHPTSPILSASHSSCSIPAASRPMNTSSSVVHPI